MTGRLSVKCSEICLISAFVAVGVCFSACAEDIASMNYTSQEEKNPPIEQERALEIGQNSLLNKYGNEEIESQKPFKAELRGDIWIVRGTLRPGVVGGVAEVWVSRFTGEVLKMKHGE